MLESILSGSGLSDLFSRSIHSIDLDPGQIALANQVTRADDDVWISIVNIVILCLTLLGSGMILISMFYLEYFRGRPGTTRTRIVQALIVSDFLLGIIGLISSCLSIEGDGHLIAHGTVSCDGLGFMLTTVLWTEHGWTLILAVATFMILIYPLHWFTLWLEKKWYFLWAFVWVISTAVAVMGYELYGFYPSGGLCFYGANAGLYSELMQFIPRCVVCIAITILYAKLYIFLKRPDKIRLPGSNSGTGGAYETVSSSSNKGDFRDRLGSLMNNVGVWKKRGSSGEVLAPLPQGDNGPRHDSSNSSSSDIPPPIVRPLSNQHVIPAASDNEKAIKEKEPTRRGSAIRRPSFSPIKEIPPWEKLELPSFQVDGERFGGPSSSSNNNYSSSIWSGWKGMGQRKRSSTTTVSVSGSNTTHFNSPSSRLNSISNSLKVQNQNQNQYNNQNQNQNQNQDTNAFNPNNLKITPPGSYIPRMPSIPSEGIVPLGNPVTEVTPSSTKSHQRASTDDTYISQSLTSSSTAISDKKRKKSVQLPLSPKSVNSNISSPEIGSSPKIDRQRPSVTISEDPEQEIIEPTNQAHGRATSQPPPSINLPPRPENPWSLSTSINGGKSEPTTPTPYQQNFRFNVATSPLSTPDQMVNYNEFSAASSRKTSKNADQLGKDGVKQDTSNQDDEDDDEWDLAKMLSQPPPGTHSTDDRFAFPQTQTNGESFELVPESMSSYLNRKTALLMLWFPLGYLFLFSVSLIRLIYDFAGNPPVGLRAISKWMVLAQGLLDAIIYGVVEWHTKRVVRKRVRTGGLPMKKGATPTNSKLGFTGNSAIGGFLKNMGTRASGGVVNSQNDLNMSVRSGGRRTPGETSRNNHNVNFGMSSISSNHNQQFGNGQGGGTTSSSYFIPEEEEHGANSTENQVNSERLSREKEKEKERERERVLGTGWNHEFSMGSIKEGEILNHHKLPTTNIHSPTLDQIAHEKQRNGGRNGNGAESPLGGNSVGSISP